MKNIRHLIRFEYIDERHYSDQVLSNFVYECTDVTVVQDVYFDILNVVDENTLPSTHMMRMFG